MKKNALYTTITVSDFCDSEYINSLKALHIGFELALLQRDLEQLKEELDEFLNHFEHYNIAVQHVRIHQPEMSSFDELKKFFEYCASKGLVHFTIHPPYEMGSDENIKNLVPQGTHLEVEEVNMGVHGKKRFEQLMQDQVATVILDVYECGGVAETILRLQYLRAQDFVVKSIHLQKDKHKFLTCDEVRLLSEHFSGNFVNEGFVKAECSFEEFVQTKSLDCIVPNKKRVEILKAYLKVLV